MPDSNILKFATEFASAELVLMEHDKARLRGVYSKKRRKGYGSSLMQEIVDYADEKSLELYLVVQSFGRPTKGLTNEQLQEFYSKFGFEKVKHPGKFVMMCRKRSQKTQAL